MSLARLCLCACLLAAALMLRTYRIEGASMGPGLMPGDLVLGETASLCLGSPARGGVYAFRDPADPTGHLIKRVVGVPGDALALRGRVLYRNGGPEPEEYACYGPGLVRDLDATRVGPDAVVVLGDRRDRSRDSRELGPVRIPTLEARIRFRLWPPSRAGAVP